ncbi:hypothetical protein EAE99_011337 [Botrytis elliptica]|nr:hypothetical protein EAE99_011337 [Botrytis elliptica]
MIFRILLCALVISGANSSLTTNTNFPGTTFPDLNEASIEDLAEGLKDKEFTSVDLINATRINDVNDALNAVVEINPDAILIASMLDNERSMGTLRGPLHGIPILIKDVIATNDKMNNTAGSHALSGAKVPADSTIARKLREAGAIILGKTNPSQWGHFRSFSISNGFSSGSAVAATLGLATVCLSAEISGSIIAPSHYNNIVGIKPIPVSEHMDTIGPMTKTVKDGAYALQSIAGVDPLDNYTSAIPCGANMDFVNACNISALKGTRLGVPRNVISLMSDNSTGSMLEAFNKSLAILRSAGAVIIENTDFPTAQESIDNGLLTVQIVAADFVDAALQNWNNTDYEFWRTYQRALDWGNEGGLLGVIERYKLDAVVLPSLFSSNWAAVVGAPIISVPMGAMPSDQPIVSDADGLVSVGPNIPFGFSFLRARFTNAKLIGLAYAFEQITMKRRMVNPYIKPRTDLRDVVGMHCQ